MPVNSSSIPSLRAARNVRRKRRAEGGAVDAPAEDWREREAREGLAFQEPAPQSTWDTVKGVASSAADMAKRFTNYDRQLTEDVLSVPKRIYDNPGAFTHGMRNLLGLNPGEERTQLWPEKMVRSGVSLAHDVGTGAVPQFDPQTGHTSGAMIERAQDMAGMAGGQTLLTGARDAIAAPAAGAGRDFRVLGRQVLATDSQAVGAPLAAMEHAPKFYSGLERAIEALPEQTMTGSEWLGRVWEPGSTKTVGVRDANNRVVIDPVTGRPVTKQVEVQGRSPLAGVKQEELEHVGLLDFLTAKADQPVSKAEVAQHLGANQVKLGEKELGAVPAWEQLAPEKQWEMVDRWSMAPPRARERYEEIRAQSPEDLETGGTKYHSYQLPGGENYREKLLTLPARKGEHGLPEGYQLRDENAEARAAGYDVPPEIPERWSYGGPGVGSRIFKTREEAIADAVRTADQMGNSGTYKSSHWDEPNVLAHRRTNERDVNGQRSLHMEELQSDWHQAGRKQGYQGEVSAEHKGLIAERDKLAGEVAEIQHNVANYGRDPDYISKMDRITDINEQIKQPYGQPAGVPDAPFKKNWHELALKDAIREAAEKGLDRISWTPGEAQAARYDLSKQVEAVRANKNPDGTYQIGVKPHGRNMVPHDTSVPANKLADVVGKELAEKIVKEVSEPGVEQGKVFSGLDLKVGGEGMKGFYDKIIPDAMNKIGKKHGVKVEKGDLPESHKFSVLDQRGQELRKYGTRAEAENWLSQQGPAKDIWKVVEKTPQSVHYMDIPKSLKDEVLQKGFSLFEDSASAGAPVAAAESAAKGVEPQKRYTRDELERMDIDDLDRMAFGFVGGQKLTVSPKDLKIKYPGDLANPQDKFDKKGMGWARSVDFSEPIQLSVGRDGKLYVEDGHHRYFAAKKLGRDLPAEIEKVEGKPIEAILKRQSAGDDSDLAASLLAEQESKKKKKKPAIEIPERKAGGAVTDPALNVARQIRRAKGGKVHVGPIVGDTGGRADKVPMSVPDGAYVIPADIISGMGEGNTDAGMLKLGKMFPKSKPSLMKGMPEKPVPIQAAHGEFVISPQSVLDRWGDLDYGHRCLDAWVLQERDHLIKTLKGLAPPAQD